MKVFLLDWMSVLFFWGAALFFCFIGTEAGFKYWKRKLLIGVPFFLLFVFLVQAWGAPRYFVYDDVAPQMLDGKPYYPAVKNHLIFQRPSFKTYGVISQDLTDFKQDDTLFASFKVTPLKRYPSVSGIKGWTNELILLAYFVLWFLLLNKMHNASAASLLYREARNIGRLEGYRRYLNASHPIRFLQPIKRRNAKRQFNEIRMIYIRSLQAVLNSLIAQSKGTSSTTLAFISQRLSDSINPRPSINAKGLIEDITTKDDETLYEANVDLKRSHYTPSNHDLSHALTNSLTQTLNQFLPEPFLQVADDPLDATIALNCELVMRAYARSELKDSKKKLTLVVVANKTPQDDNEHCLALRHQISPFPPKIYQHGREKSKKLCANTLAQMVVNDTLFSTTQMVNVSAENALALKTKLAQIKARQNALFDTIIQECKSTAKDAALAESINYVIKQNEALFDSVMSDVHQLIADNSNLYADFVAQEVIGGLLEDFAEVASD
ncbi:hypothetical protein [Alteromonas sp. C1M14]|uniref:hypothetical protein n=1 Tax=Alteromonas sp. C1M14 TaxID=2841567 RepID=UPI001C0A2BF8|nr:hypothetical protein [Alteromonas sp. C1M14]MBU2978231.1 hypothetical protein [Alteromonas sp. C1M14]